MRYVVLATVLGIVAQVILRSKEPGWPRIIAALLLTVGVVACSIYWWVHYVIWEW